jgi:lipopolysaccharide/colanic/teichoic acid biosynthesis glycosyltransferase
MSGACYEIPGRGSDSHGVPRSISNTYIEIKSWLDFPLAVIILSVTAPVILLSLLIVKLTSKGPPLYTQRRVGRQGRLFTIYKIRTMVQHSEPNGPKWCLPGDPRVTRVGRLLRSSHLDELPQLMNVLRGEMSLIGPRPERPEIVAQLERVLPYYRQRLIVRPGLSGLAQVLNPPDTDLRSVRAKLDYDLHYIDHACLALDFKIALATVLHLLNAPRGLILRLIVFPIRCWDDPNVIQSLDKGRLCGVARDVLSASELIDTGATSELAGN